jgi:hypothetical protein
MKKLIVSTTLIIFSIMVFQGCATVSSGSSSSGNVSDSSALGQVSPLLLSKQCPTKIGYYVEIKNRHKAKEISAKIQTEISPDPDNMYPKSRSYNIKPGTTRILGCTQVQGSEGGATTNVSFSILSAEYK